MVFELEGLLHPEIDGKKIDNEPFFFTLHDILVVYLGHGIFHFGR